MIGRNFFAWGVGGVKDLGGQSHSFQGEQSGEEL